MNTFLEGGNLFLGGEVFGGRDKILRPMKMLVFAMIIAVLTFLGLGVKFSRWGKNSLDEVKIHQVGTSETVTCVESNF